MPRKVLVVTTADASKSQVETVVRAHAGDDAEVQVVAPASKVSFFQLLSGAIDDARADAEKRAEAVAPDAEHAHVGDSDPLQAIEDALRLWPADEVVVLTPPEDEATWLESGLGELAKERFSLPVTHLVSRS